MQEDDARRSVPVPAGAEPPLEVFVDVLMRVQVHAGVARVDLGVIEQPEGPSGRLVRDRPFQPASRLRLLMPLEGLRRAVDNLQKVMEEVDAATSESPPVPSPSEFN